MSGLVVGWSLIVAGFVGGALLGAGFHRDDFLGGYGSWQRRLLRLGHVACVALGVLNLLFAATVPRVPLASSGATLLAAGGVAMPLCCFVVAFVPRLRPLFAIPVALLIAAASIALAATLQSGVTS